MLAIFKEHQVGADMDFAVGLTATAVTVDQLLKGPKAVAIVCLTWRRLGLEATVALWA